MLEVSTVSGQWCRSMILVHICPFKHISLLFLAVLGLHCCAVSFSSCGEQRLLSHCRVQASPCNAFPVPAPQLRGCVSWAWLPCGLWDLLRAEIEAVSAASAGGFLTPGPPEKLSTHPPPPPPFVILKYWLFQDFLLITYCLLLPRRTV